MAQKSPQQQTKSNNDTNIGLSLYALCKTMTFPLLTSFYTLIKLPIHELADMVEVFANETHDNGGESIIYENGERIKEIEVLRR